MVLSGLIKNIYGIRFISFFLLLTGSVIAKKKIIPEIELNVKEEYYTNKWKEYGAYYDLNDFRVTHTTDYNNFKTKFHIHKRIKILSTDGTKYGTVPIYRYASMIPHFELTLRDENGQIIPIDQKKIKKEYLKSWKIVFPKVKAGMEIEVSITFINEYVYYTGYVRNFSEPIPARVNRFVCEFSKHSPFEFKDYGSRYKIKQQTLKKRNNIIKLFTVNEYTPRPDLPYQDYESNTEPYVILRLIKLAGKRIDLITLKSICNKYRKKTKATSMKISRESLLPITRDIINETEEPKEMAEKILNWVQINLIPDNRTSIPPENVLKYGKGSSFQITCVCNKMFQIAGLKSTVIFSFSKKKCKIDTSFLFYSPMATGFPLVTIDNQSYVSYPFAKGFELGEYHEDFYDVIYINPEAEKVGKLPLSKYEQNDWEKITHIINPRKIDEARIIYSYKKNCANVIRSQLIDNDKVSQKKYLEERLKNYSQNNVIQSFTIHNSKDYKKPLEIIINYTNDNTPIVHRKSKIINLANYFCTRFSDIDLKRKTGIFIHDNNTTIEEIIIKKLPENKVIPNMKLKELHNDLFSVKISKSENDTSFVYKRILTYNKCHIKPDNLKGIYQDCVELNNIKNSHITIR